MVPSDEKVVFPVTRKGNTDIYVYDLSANNVEPLLNSSFNEMAPEWSEGGNMLYFVANFQDKNQIWKVDLLSHEPSPTLFIDLTCDSFVKKGNEIYYSNVTQEEIRKLNLAENTDELVTSTLRKKDTRNWEIRGDNLYYIRLDPKYVRVLVKKSLTDGSEIILSDDEAVIDSTLQGISTNQPGIAVSQDEKTILAVTYAGRSPEIVILKR